MKKHFELPEESFWEKYAIIPFFLVFASMGLSIGYLVEQEKQKEDQEMQRYEMKEFLRKQNKMR